VTDTGARANATGRPYPGTRPFQRHESGWFFGRDRDADAIAELWRTNNLTIVVGPTGSGKTSLLQAGLMPLVEGSRAEVLPAGRVSYGVSFPAAGLPAHNPYTLALLRAWSPAEPATRLAGLTVGDYIHARAERHGGVIFAVLDQAEELLADPGPRTSSRRWFLGELSAAVQREARLHLLVCVRASALEELSQALGGGAQYFLAPLGSDAAVAAVTGPAEAAGLRFAPGAAEELVADILTGAADSAEGAEPPVADEFVYPVLLQIACTRLWDGLPADLGNVTRLDVRRHGDVGTALSAHWGRVIAAVADENGVPAVRLRSWLTRTFVTEHGHRRTAYEGISGTAGMPTALARALEDRHLLNSEWRSSSRWYELISDRLIKPLQDATDEPPPRADPAVWRQGAEHALTLGDLDLAEHYATEALRVAPSAAFRLRAELYSLLGNVAHERDKPVDAETSYRQAAALSEVVRDTAAVAYQLAATGASVLAQGRVADAVTELTGAVERCPSDLVLQTELGWVLWQLGDSRAAEAIFTGVLAVDGGNVEALRGRGEVLANLGDARGALRDLDRLDAVDLPVTRAARGLALAQLGVQAEASAEIKAALIEAPRNGPVLLYAARAMQIGGDGSAAHDLAERAVNASDPSLSPHQREAARKLASPGEAAAAAEAGESRLNGRQRSWPASGKQQWPP
jgi:tetratricopeptide (TPR) repeat protein